MNEPSNTRQRGQPARPTIEQVQRLRGQLLGLTLFVLIAFSAALVGASFTPGLHFAVLGEAQDVIRYSLLALSGMFVVYVVHRERRLRGLNDALVNERVLSAALRNQMRQLSLLAQAGRAVTSTDDINDTLDVVLRSAVDLLEADEGSIFLLDGGDLVLSAASGTSERFLGHRQPTSDGVAGYVARTGRPLLIQGDLDMADLFDIIDNPAHRDMRIRSSVSVPLRARDELIGVMNLNVIGGGRSYEEYDRQTLELFAHHASIAVLQARLLSKLGKGTREQAAQLDRMRSDLVDRLTHEESVVEDTELEISSSEPRQRRNHRPRVLVADDDAALLHFLQIALETEDFEVLLASDGATAVDRTKREYPDVLLLDLSLPVMDGWRVLDALRDRARRPRVVCISASHDRRDRARAWMAGVDEYVAKPFEVATLATVVRRVLHRSEDEHAERRDEALRELFAAG